MQKLVQCNFILFYFINSFSNKVNLFRLDKELRRKNSLYVLSLTIFLKQVYT